MPMHAQRTLEEAAAELRGVVSGTQTVLTLSADVSKAAVKDAVSEVSLGTSHWQRGARL